MKQMLVHTDGGKEYDTKILELFKEGYRVIPGTVAVARGNHGSSYITFMEKPNLAETEEKPNLIETYLKDLTIYQIAKLLKKLDYQVYARCATCEYHEQDFTVILYCPSCGKGWTSFWVKD